MERSPFAVTILIGVLLVPTSVPATDTPPDGAGRDTQTQQSGALEGTVWRLESYRIDGEDRQPVSSRDARLRLEEGRISGNGGCNRLMGSYDLQGAQLSIEVRGTTMMACPEGMEQEDAYLRALGTVAKYRIEGGELTLVNGEGKPAAKFQTAE